MRTRQHILIIIVTWLLLGPVEASFIAPQAFCPDFARHEASSTLAPGLHISDVKESPLFSKGDGIEGAVPSQIVEITNESGVHGRPAGFVTEIARKYKDISIKIVKVNDQGEEMTAPVDADSLMGLAAMRAVTGEKLKIYVEKPEDHSRASEAISAVVDIIKSLAWIEEHLAYSQGNAPLYPQVVGRKAMILELLDSLGINTPRRFVIRVGQEDPQQLAAYLREHWGELTKNMKKDWPKSYRSTPFASIPGGFFTLLSGMDSRTAEIMQQNNLDGWGKYVQFLQDFAFYVIKMETDEINRINDVSHKKRAREFQRTINEKIREKYSETVIGLIEKKYSILKVINPGDNEWKKFGDELYAAAKDIFGPQGAQDISVLLDIELMVKKESAELLGQVMVSKMEQEMEKSEGEDQGKLTKRFPFVRGDDPVFPVDIEDQIAFVARALSELGRGEELSEQKLIVGIKKTQSIPVGVIVMDMIYGNSFFLRSNKKIDGDDPRLVWVEEKEGDAIAANKAIPSTRLNDLPVSEKARETLRDYVKRAHVLLGDVIQLEGVIETGTDVVWITQGRSSVATLYENRKKKGVAFVPITVNDVDSLPDERDLDPKKKTNYVLVFRQIPEFTKEGSNMMADPKSVLFGRMLDKGLKVGLIVLESGNEQSHIVELTRTHCPVWLGMEGMSGLETRDNAIYNAKTKLFLVESGQNRETSRIPRSSATVHGGNPIDSAI